MQERKLSTDKLTADINSRILDSVAVDSKPIYNTFCESLTRFICSGGNERALDLAIGFTQEVNQYFFDACVTDAS